VTTDPAGGRAGFQRQQSALVDGEIHYTRLTDVTYAWDDSDNVWQTMSGSGSIPDATAASGGGIKGKITVDSDYGLAVTSGVLAIDLAASNPGLEFDVSGDLQADVDTTAGLEIGAGGIAIDLAAAGSGTGGLEFDGSGDLQVKVDGAHGIILNTSGLEIEIDDTPDTLDVDADGLKVVGLPEDFKIAGVATHYDDSGTGQVSAANLDTLTAGSSSNADSLHTHASSPATEAPKVENTLTTATDATANGDPVYINGDETVGKSLANDDTKSRVIGVIRSGGGAAPASVEVVSLGICAGILTSATPGVPYYLQAAGGIGPTPPSGGNRVIQVGWAYGDTDLWVELKDFGKKAA
jgi:hypothetical protein